MDNEDDRNELVLTTRPGQKRLTQDHSFKVDQFYRYLMNQREEM